MSRSRPTRSATVSSDPRRRGASRRSVAPVRPRGSSRPRRRSRAPRPGQPRAGPGAGTAPEAAVRSAHALAAWPSPAAAREQTGICQVCAAEPSEPTGRNRFCESASFAPSPLAHSSATSTSGTPGWSRKVENAAATPGLLWRPRSRARKSFDVAVPYACAFMYRRTPARNFSGPIQASNIEMTAPPFWYEMRVEGVVDVVVGLDRLADLARRDERVVAPSTFERSTTRSTCSPHVGCHSVDRAVRHPGGERLVQPHVVPPGERHEVAEPLVRDLVGVDRGLEAPPLDRLVLAAPRAGSTRTR